MPKVECQCDSCDGTGVYSGMCEGPGHAVVCLGCDGTGKTVLTYKEFTGLKRAKGIKTVAASRGRFLATGVGSKGESIPYAEFYAGKKKPR